MGGPRHQFHRYGNSRATGCSERGYLPRTQQLAAPVINENDPGTHIQGRVVYHHLGRSNVPAMFRTREACVAIADVNNQELADAATLEKDPTVVNEH